MRNKLALPRAIGASAMIVRKRSLSNYGVHAGLVSGKRQWIPTLRQRWMAWMLTKAAKDRNAEPPFELSGVASLPGAQVCIARALLQLLARGPWTDRHVRMQTRPAISRAIPLGLRWVRAEGVPSSYLTSVPRVNRGSVLLHRLRQWTFEMRDRQPQNPIPGHQDESLKRIVSQIIVVVFFNMPSQNHLDSNTLKSFQ